ncbi:MAG: DUF5305 domain-containing protein [Firmicutes bacterium]|nr:DUF5305 domain-containing protein [Bacillota bacterium]
MKKYKVKKRIRQSVIVVFLFLLVLSAAGLSWSYLIPMEKVEETTLYSYNQEAWVDYQVQMLPSATLPESVVGPGRAYIANWTEYISTDLSYRFHVDDNVAIKGEYSVIAALKASVGGENLVVWERTDELLPPQSFSGSGSVYIRKNVIVPIADYLEYARVIREETDFSPENLDLEVQYKVRIEALTSPSVIREELVPTMIIPLRGNTFTVGGELKKQTAGNVTDDITVFLPYVETARFGFVIAAGVSLVLLLAFLLMTFPVQQAINLQEKEVNMILKKHQDRIVSCTGQATIVPEKTIVVSSFEDLLKTADELGKPIVYYKNDLEKGARHSFFVLSAEYIYTYFIDVVPLSLSMLKYKTKAGYQNQTTG